MVVRMIVFEAYACVACLMIVAPVALLLQLPSRYRARLSQAQQKQATAMKAVLPVVATAWLPYATFTSFSISSLL